MESVASVVILIVLGIAAVIIARLVAGSMDRGRIEDYIRERDGELLDRSWAPFGPGWFGEKEARIYQIAYRDKHGNVHQAHAKTSMFSGVYLTNDRIVERAYEEVHHDPHAGIHAGIETEEELRREVARLRRRLQEFEGDQEAP